MSRSYSGSGSGGRVLAAFQTMKPIAKTMFRFFLPMTLLSTLPMAACAYRVHREREVVVERPRREVIVEERHERPREEVVIEHR